MNPLPSLLRDLAVLIGSSALVAYLGQRYLRVVPLVGFLLTGALIGPNALGIVAEPHLAEQAAEIGVILLLFTIGIEFSLERLARIRRLIFGGGSLQLLLTGGAVAGVLLAVGVPWRPAVYTGMLAALSSTVIVLKLLADRGATGSAEGQAALGILLFQDLAVVVMVLLLPALAGSGGGSGVLIALAKAAGIIVLVLVLARRLMPPILERVAQTCSPDIFLLSIVAICFGTAWLAAIAGVGVSLGAFLAGLVVSESRFSEHALSEVLPLRILFSAAFFVSVGMLLDPGFLLQRPLLVLGVVAGVFVVKTVTTTGSLLALGAPAAVSVPAAFLLAQVGEFSFVLERRGTELGLYPAGIPGAGGQAFIAATVLLLIATPGFAAAGSRIAKRLARRPRSDVETPSSSPQESPQGSIEGDRTGHVILGGYGRTARALARHLVSSGIEPTILTLSPDGAREAEAEGRLVIRGDYTRRQILELAALQDARLMVVADDDARMTERVVSVVRALNPGIELIVRTDTIAGTDDLLRAGADHVVATEDAADRELARQVLASAGVPPEDIARLVAGSGPELPAVQLSQEARSSDRCSHAGSIEVVGPRTPSGCEECLAAGQRWVHLRLCMSCGHVGCCDNSPGRHATAHHQATAHPIIRSWEPGEDWAWCYVDEVML